MLPPSKSLARIVYIINQSERGAKSGAVPVPIPMPHPHNEVVECQLRGRERVPYAPTAERPPCIEFPDKLLAGQWEPLISARLSANIYVNPVGGREMFNRAEFTRQGVALQFLDFKPFIYDTLGYKFEENLSMLDVLMWKSPDAFVQAIRENSLLIAELKTEYAATGDT